jgi:hypothetical protein
LREPGESYNEWLSREDPDSDLLYETWREREEPLWVEDAVEDVMSTEEVP